MNTRSLVFPADFLWGAATSAYQIEGGWDTDGKGESIWDRFSHTPGNIRGGDTGDVAADHYHCWAEDIALMRQVGLQAYRFSISWPRVLPTGRGGVNVPGLDFYDRLVDGLLQAGIEPFVTLYHWDLPQALQDLGGWGNRDVCGWFADYAAVMVRRLGDRVRYWTTHNEPLVTATHGHLTGEHAPGLRDRQLSYRVAHHVLVSHGLAAQAVRAIRPAAEVGIVLNAWPTDTAPDSPHDQALAESRWQTDERWYLDPLFRACYPPEVWEALGADAPDVRPGDMALVAQRLDYLGINYYSRNVLKGGRIVDAVPGSEYTTMGWEVYAPALRRLLKRIHDEYPPVPLYITENGGAYADEVSPDGQVHDERRIAYLRDHLAQLCLAIEDGVDVRGYFAWSLFDNFEWAHGYSQRFGLIYIDFATQARILKDSAKWYAQTIAANAVRVE